MPSSNIVGLRFAQHQNYSSLLASSTIFFHGVGSPKPVLDPLCQHLRSAGPCYAVDSGGEGADVRVLFACMASAFGASTAAAATDARPLQTTNNRDLNNAHALGSLLGLQGFPTFLVLSDLSRHR